MANTKINRTPSTSGSSTINTWSFWIKRSEITTAQNIYAAVVNAGNDFGIKFTNTDELEIRYWYSGAYQFRIITNRKFKDVSGWYNIVIIQNAGASTNTDRLQVWINGVRETSFGTTDFPTSGQGAAPINSTSAIQAIGYNGDNSSYFSGSMSHINFVDGTAYNPSYFGSTDSTTGEWKINVSPSVTYGTNGYFILKDGNTITDSSTNSNNFSLGGGTLTKTEDCPDNVFATINPLWRANQTNTHSNGNLTATNGAKHRPNVPTIAPSSGKWYMEAKAISGSTTKWWIGYADQEWMENNQNLASGTNMIWGGGNITGEVNQRSVSLYNNGLQLNPNSNIDNFFSSGSCSAGDIMGIAVDLDNQKAWWSKNGVWRNGSASESTTWNSSYPDTTQLDVGRNYYIGVGSENTTWSVNYGNGYFGSTQISSAGTNASGIGIFEYDVPTGFTALSTKGLNL